MVCRKNSLVIFDITQMMANQAKNGPKAAWSMGTLDQHAKDVLLWEAISLKRRYTRIQGLSNKTVLGIFKHLL